MHPLPYRTTVRLSEGVSAAVRSRLLLFMENLAEPVDEAELLLQRSPLSGIWAGVSARTRTRDLARLEDLGLIVREDGVIRPRYEVMEQFRP